jgi:cytochrome oxidase Cu insertion factor (SCO1/SenC/PrrC family)
MKLRTGKRLAESLAARADRRSPLAAVAMAVVVGTVAAAPPLMGSIHGPSLRRSNASEATQHQHAAEGTNANSGSTKNYTLSTGSYVPPDVVLTDRHGGKVRLADLIAQPRPVLLEFIFTSCATICPILSATLSQAQEDLRRTSEDFAIISISIDPEYDTPEKLDGYARRYHPGDNWLFLTGSKEDIVRVLKAFDALYQSDNKMYHRPYTFVHAQSGATWIRLEGFPSVAELLKEYKSALLFRTNPAK